MILITSGAYVGHELASEIGLIPASFLVSGNKRLYRHQLELLKNSNEQIYLSLPDDFEIMEDDKKYFKNNNIKVITTPPSATLTEALRVCLSLMLPFDEPLRILHGDTLIWGIPQHKSDVFSIGKTDSFYSWAEYRKTGNNGIEFIEGLPNGGFAREVLSGYFCFSNPYFLLQSLSQCKNKFSECLNRYNEKCALTPTETGRWLDFGHLQTYYRSKALMTTERNFNSLKITQHEVIKSGQKAKKIHAEAQWFKSIPPSLTRYTPALLGTGEKNGFNEYQLEYLYLSTLSELFVFGRLPVFLWENIFESCSEFLTACRTYKPTSKDVIATSGLYLDKTLARLDRFARERNIQLDKDWKINGENVPSLKRIAHITAAEISKVSESDLGVMHGDFCFSNILYDFRHGVIKVIDPRGLNSDGQHCIFGDLRYDFAKLYHSVVGRYDFIKADMFSLKGSNYSYQLELPDDKFSRAAQNVFISSVIGGKTCESAKAAPIAILLFLSMLPLHGDKPEHQNALLANGLRLFKEFDKTNKHSLPKYIPAAQQNIATATIASQL